MLAYLEDTPQNCLLGKHISASLTSETHLGIANLENTPLYCLFRIYISVLLTYEIYLGISYLESHLSIAYFENASGYC